MPNYLTHLAIAKVYARKHDVRDVPDFLKGNIAPDIMRAEGTVHHYKHKLESQDIKKSATDRIDLVRCLSEIDTATDFGKGVFLHMLVDNFCYFNVLDFEKFQQAINHGADIQASIHKSFEKYSDYISKKYNIDFVDFRVTGCEQKIKEDQAQWAELMKQRIGVDDILEIVMLDKFIDWVTKQPIESIIADLKKTF